MAASLPVGQPGSRGRVRSSVFKVTHSDLFLLSRPKLPQLPNSLNLSKTCVEMGGDRGRKEGRRRRRFEQQVNVST